jgi:uncharacterized protein (DUF1697 family)
MRYVAFLRALNVGGNHLVKMDALRGHFEALGLAGVETFIASGNVIFESAARDRAKLEKKIEAHLDAVLGHEVRTFLRTDAEVAEIAAGDPFADLPGPAALALNVGFLAAPLSAAERKVLATFETESDRLAGVGSEIWWRCAVRQSESRFLSSALEKKLGKKLTWRGLNTVQRLAAKYPPAAPRAARG